MSKRKTYPLSSYYGLARSWLIYYGQPWRRPARIRFYSQLIQPGSLCFDIGAHLGNRVDAFLTCGAQKVVAVEPQPLFYRYLQNRYGQEPHTEILNLGIDSKEGVKHLYLSSATPTVSSFSADWIKEVQQDIRFESIQWNHTEQISMISLDDLIEKYGRPDFCKIDVEGFEEQALQGLSSALPALSFEYIPIAKERAFRCLDRLEMLAEYEYNYCQKERMQWCHDAWMNAAEMKQRLEHMTISAPSGDIYARLVVD